MAILRRKHDGKFRKALVRVGDIAVCDTSTKALGITADKAYKVIATALSSKKNREVVTPYVHSECTTPFQFMVINDYGEPTFCSLPVKGLFNIKVSKSIFGEWKISSVK